MQGDRELAMQRSGDLEAQIQDLGRKTSLELDSYSDRELELEIDENGHSFYLNKKKVIQLTLNSIFHQGFLINIEFLCSSMKDTELFDDREFFVMPDEEDEPAVQSLPQNLPHPEALAHMHASHAPTPSEYS